VKLIIKVILIFSILFVFALMDPVIMAYSQSHFEKIAITKQQEHMKQLIRKEKLSMAERACLVKSMESFQVVENEG
jgi:hypothetical protein